MKTFTPRRSRNFRRSKFFNRQSTTKKPMRLGSIELDALMLNGVALAMIIFAGLSYLLVINQTSVGGFEIKELERANETLKQDNRQLELSRAELHSLVAIEEASKELNMVAVTDFEYLPAVGSIVAVK